MLFTEINVIYIENYTNMVNTPCMQNEELLVVTSDGIDSYH
jgi:hypothetical protein